MLSQDFVIGKQLISSKGFFYSTSDIEDFSEDQVHLVLNELLSWFPHIEKLEVFRNVQFISFFPTF